MIFVLCKVLLTSELVADLICSFAHRNYDLTLYKHNTTFRLPGRSGQYSSQTKPTVTVTLTLTDTVMLISQTKLGG